MFNNGNLSKKPKTFTILLIVFSFVFIFSFFFESFSPVLIELSFVFVFLFVVLKPKNSSFGSNVNNLSVNTPTICSNCGTTLEQGSNFCSGCGSSVSSSIVIDPLYLNSIDSITEQIIKENLKHYNYDEKDDIKQVKTKKIILTAIFVTLNIIFICSIFFHLPVFFYLVEVLNVLLYFIFLRKYNTVKYILKEVKARQDEDISNVVYSIINGQNSKNYSFIYIVVIIASFILPIFLFINPHVFYEKSDDGYYVRFYTFGLTNFTSVSIPDNYNGEEVVGIRGNVFANMYFLRSVDLPDTITTIRGKAFMNDYMLSEVNIPSGLVYLGGSSFKNCHSLETVELPDTLTFLGGESFMNASSLKSIKLSSSLTEIRGNTFENCSSLEVIEIPNGVTRIGGHAFYGNSSLTTVTISKYSKLKEIGSSAFRECSNLEEITIPLNASVNPRAFKNSPTIVNRYSQPNYGEYIDKDSYKYTTFMYMSIGEKQVVDSYRSDSVAYNSYIKLENINVVNDFSEFSLSYSDNKQTKKFILSSNNPYIEINSNIAVEVSSRYIFSNESAISIKVYYN